jgi:hypothetical protein
MGLVGQSGAITLESQLEARATSGEAAAKKVEAFFQRKGKAAFDKVHELAITLVAE